MCKVRSHSHIIRDTEDLAWVSRACDYPKSIEPDLHGTEVSRRILGLRVAQTDTPFRQKRFSL